MYFYFHFSEYTEVCNIFHFFHPRSPSSAIFSLWKRHIFNPEKESLSKSLQIPFFQAVPQFVDPFLEVLFTKRKISQILGSKNKLFKNSRIIYKNIAITLQKHCNMYNQNHWEDQKNSILIA